jgi:hypothetical protein
MALEHRHDLKNLHRLTGAVLSLCNRLMVSVVVLGGAFFLMTLVSVRLANEPENILRMQGFMFNYTEFSRAETLQQPQAGSVSNASARPQDPDWDGALAGGGLGLTLGRTIPFVGVIIGPITGAMLGFKLDSRI